MNSEIKFEMREYLQRRSEKILDLAGRPVQILKDVHAFKIADECHCSVHEVYLAALETGICPYRYVRNREIISEREQLKLAKSRVAVIGAGGLGGQVIVLLARVGIGYLVVIDHDTFDETNLNRQALCSQNALGKSKSEEAVAVVGSINPGVEAIAYRLSIDSANAQEILTGADVVVDALDNIPDRLAIENEVKKLKIPLVHGAVAGFEGQIMTIFPQDHGLENLYGRGETIKDKRQSPESIFGIPALIPAVIGTFQVMEVLKIILERGTPFRNMMVHMDLVAAGINEFRF